MGCLRGMLQSVFTALRCRRQKTSSIRSVVIGPPTNFRKETCMFQPFSDDEDGYVMMIHSQTSTSPAGKTPDTSDEARKPSASEGGSTSITLTPMDRLKAKARNLSISHCEKTDGEPTLLEKEISIDSQNTTDSTEIEPSRSSSPSPTLQDMSGRKNVPQDWSLGV